MKTNPYVLFLIVTYVNMKPKMRLYLIIFALDYHVQVCMFIDVFSIFYFALQPHRLNNTRKRGK